VVSRLRPVGPKGETHDIGIWNRFLAGDGLGAAPDPRRANQWSPAVAGGRKLFMLKARTALLGVLAVFIASGVATSAAYAGGPFWHVNGAKLNQGTKQLNLQNKGPLVLKGSALGIEAIVECSTSEGAGTTIEGSGAQKPGQGKGKLKFTNCTTKFGGSTEPCRVHEPIETNQSKAILTTSSESKQNKYALLFQPQQGNTFVVLKFENNIKTCSLGALEVKGNQAAEVIPGGGGVELQEGSLVFPATPIKKVQLFTTDGVQPQEVSVGLFLGVNEAKFSGFYKASLVTGEVFGVSDT
jgi:hypothetical protein